MARTQIWDGAQWLDMSGGGSDTAYLPLAGGTMLGYLTLNATPVNDLHAATKAYVDSVVPPPAGSHTVGSTAPPTPQEGDVWVDPDASGEPVYLPLAGGEMTGDLDIASTADIRWLDELGVIQYTMGHFANDELGIWSVPKGERIIRFHAAGGVDIRPFNGGGLNVDGRLNIIQREVGERPQFTIGDGSEAIEFRYNGQRRFLASSTSDDLVWYKGDGGTAAMHFDSAADKMELAQEAWIAPTFEWGWVNYGSSYQVARYRKDASGTVYIQGLIKGGDTSANIWFFTLPTAYRPAKDLILTLQHAGSGTISRMDIKSNGRVQSTVAGINPDWVSIDCSFATEQRSV